MVRPGFQVSPVMHYTHASVTRERYADKMNDLEVVHFISHFFGMLSEEEKIIFYHYHKGIAFQETAISLSLPFEDVYHLASELLALAKDMSTKKEYPTGIYDNNIFYVIMSGLEMHSIKIFLDDFDDITIWTIQTMIKNRQKDVI